MSLVVKTRIPSSDDIRRFCINADTSFSSLQATLKVLYPTMPRISVKYQVSDSNTIEITSEAEFRAAVSAASQDRPPILRLVLEQQSPNLLDSWIVVPEEVKSKQDQTPSLPISIPPKIDEVSAGASPAQPSPSKLFSFSSLPSIFGFQLPSFGSNSGSPSSSGSLSNSLIASSKLAEEIKEATSKAQIEAAAMEIEPEINIDLPSAPSDEMLFELSEVTEPVVEKEVVVPVTVPAPKRLRTVDVCMQLSEEVKDSCISSSNLTLSNTIPLWKNTVSDCNDYCKATLDSCSRESAAILSQISSSPSTIARECTKLSEETSRVCGKLSSDIAALQVVTGTSPAQTQEDLSLRKVCNDLSKNTAQDCCNLSRSIVAEILAL